MCNPSMLFLCFGKRCHVTTLSFSLFPTSQDIYQFQPQSSLPRNIHLNPSHSERTPSSSSSSSLPQSPYGSPTLSRKFCASPAPPRARWHHPVPLSVIMRAQKPVDVMATRHPRVMELEGDGTPKPQPTVLQHLPQSAAAEQRQSARQGTARLPLSPLFSSPWLENPSFTVTAKWDIVYLCLNKGQVI